MLAGDVDYARSVFDLMPTDTAEQWHTIAERMSRVAGAFSGMRETWRLGMQRKVVAPRRQVLAVAAMLEGWAVRRPHRVSSRHSPNKPQA